MKTKVLVSNIEQFIYPFEHYNVCPKDYNTYFADPNSVDSMLKVLINILDIKKNESFDMEIFSLENMMKEYNIIYTELLK
jgi:predicted transcriptional regulator